MYTIEIIYIVPFIFSIFALLGIYFKAINWFTAFISICASFGIGYLISPYTQLIIKPISNSLWYGYTWGLLEYIGIIHICTLFIMSFIALYNLYMSNGKKLWG